MRIASRVTHRAGLRGASSSLVVTNRRQQPQYSSVLATLVERAVAYVERVPATNFGSVDVRRGALRAAAPAHRGPEEHERAAASAAEWSAGHTALVRTSCWSRCPARAGLPFRDVFERDGKTGARSRGASRVAVPEGRTANAFDQARQIMDEGRATTSATSTGTSTCRRWRWCFSTERASRRFAFKVGKRDDPIRAS